MSFKLITPYHVVTLANWVFGRGLELSVVKEFDVYQVDASAPPNEPGGDHYLVYVHFDPATKRTYSTEAELNLAGSWIAERLIRLDESAFPGIVSRLEFHANRVTVDVDSLQGGVHSLGKGITFWIELSPGWSRLRNQSLVKLQILMMQSEVRGTGPGTRANRRLSSERAT
jgi:hypothetical protein